jgi:hypothetical protein
MNYQQLQKPYKMIYTKQSFEEVLQQAYDELEPEDIKSLLIEVNELMCSDNFENQFIQSVFTMVAKNRNISFKQWKALSAYVAECKRKEQNKNNKVF